MSDSTRTIGSKLASKITDRLKAVDSNTPIIPEIEALGVAMDAGSSLEAITAKIHLDTLFAFINTQSDSQIADFIKTAGECLKK